MGYLFFRRVVAIALLSALLQVGQLRADLIITFSNGDLFDGDVAGSTAGPFNVDGLSGTITTRGVLPNGNVNTTSGRLGINAVGSDTASRFDDGESWIFDWNIDTFFQGVNFGDFSTATETFSIQSDDWIGLSISPGSSEVTFSDTTGTLIFASGDSADDFTLNDLTGGSLLPVSAGIDIAISFSDAGGGNGSLQSITVATPEPGTFAMVGLATAALLALRQRMKKRGMVNIEEGRMVD